MRREKKNSRRLIAEGRPYMWRLRHSHRVREDGGFTECSETLTLTPQPGGSGGPLRIVFAEGPGRYVPGGGYSGSGDVGFSRGPDLNLHEPGAVRALLDAALAHGWDPGERREVKVDGWSLLEEAAAARAANAAATGS